MPNRAARWRERVEAEAGGACPVVERHRHGLTFALPNGQRRLVRSIGPMHTLTGEEIDTDLDDDGTFFRGRRLDYGIRFDRGVGRVLTPRPDHPAETVTFARPQRRVANQWRNVTPTGFQRRGHQLIFQTAGGQVTLSLLPTTVATEVTLNGAAANVPWRWPITLNGLTWLQRENSAELVDGQGVSVMFVSAPKWTDAAGKTGPVGWSYASGYLVHDAAVLPSDVVWPVVVR